MSDLDNLFTKCVNDPRNCINEHLEELYNYAVHCEHITECGVEGCTSSWAFVRGLRDNGRDQKRLVSADISFYSNINKVREVAKDSGVDYLFMQGNDIYLEFEETDLMFIDTWHVYGHLKRELARLAPKAKKWILLHDTTVDGERGESLRRNWDIAKQSRESTYPEEEIAKGIWPAVEEFLEQNKETWRLFIRRTNCNGLTILERVPK